MPRSSYIAFLIIILGITSCEQDMAKVKMIMEDKQALTETGKDVEMVYSDDGKTRARILGPVISKSLTGEPSTEFTKGLRVYMYDNNNQVESMLSANYGIAYEGKEELLVRDNVVIVNVEGRKLNSEELIWKRNEKKIYSDKFVKITTKDQIIFGEGFESSEDFSDYVIKKVTGTIMQQSDVKMEL